MTLVSPEPQLSDGVVTLRPPDERDLEAIDQGVNDPDVVRWFGRPKVRAPGILAVNRQRWRDGSPTFAICEIGDACLGHVWINISSTDPGTGSVGYWLLPSARGRGLATRAVRLLTTWAVGALGLDPIRLVTESANEQSQGVAARSGFRRRGTESGRSELDGRPVELIVFAWSAEDTNRR